MAKISAPGGSPVFGSAVTQIFQSTTDPIKGAVSKDVVSYQVDNGVMIGFFNYRQTAAGTDGDGSVFIGIPDSYQIDLTKLTAESVDPVSSPSVGNLFCHATNVGNTICTLHVASDTRLVVRSTNGGNHISHADVPFSNVDLIMQGSFMVPVVE